MLRKQSSLKIAHRSTAKVANIPAPRGGMDDRIGIGSGNADVCLWAINMMPSEYGMRVRQGYRVWQEGLPSEIRTVIPYEGLVETDTDDKIFSVCAEGIYDTSISSGAPVQKLAFDDNGDDAGWGVYIHYIDASGDDIIYYADAANGLFIYTPATDTWAQASGLVPAPDSIGTFAVEDIDFIMVHKLRIWFKTKGSNKAWYLGVRAYTGEATEFFFGAKFKHGGDLVGMFNWTVDGGDGRDDAMVVVSRGGDVLPYTGDDPSSDLTWENTGVFFIGRVPRGNRIASQYGGNLFLLSTLGLVTMAELVAGAEPEDPARSQLGARISRLIRLDMRKYASYRGWKITFVADEAIVVVSTPLRLEDGTYRQYVLNTTTMAWGLWRDLPFTTGEAYSGDLLIGDPTGRLLRMDVDVDDVPSVGGVGAGVDIKWYVLSSFTDANEPGVQKRVQMVRPHFSSDGASPSFECTARYDYFALEPLAPVQPPAAFGSYIWDTGLWDDAHWAVPQQRSIKEAHGTWGMGTVFAIAMTGRSRGNTLFASWDVLYDSGHFL